MSLERRRWPFALLCAAACSSALSNRVPEDIGSSLLPDPPLEQPVKPAGAGAFAEGARRAVTVLHNAEIQLESFARSSESEFVDSLATAKSELVAVASAIELEMSALHKGAAGEKSGVALSNCEGRSARQAALAMQGGSRGGTADTSCGSGDCTCAWWQRLYPKLASAAGGKNHEGNATTNEDFVDVGVCDVSVSMLVFLSMFIFFSLFAVLVTLRLWLRCEEILTIEETMTAHEPSVKFTDCSKEVAAEGAAEKNLIGRRICRRSAAPQATNSNHETRSTACDEGILSNDMKEIGAAAKDLSGNAPKGFHENHNRA